MKAQESQTFSEFVVVVEQLLLAALTAAYGPDVGADATAEALGYGWEHWDRLKLMSNPAGYLYRVGQSKARRYFWKRLPVAPDIPVHAEPLVEPGLPAALRGLTRRQRSAVVLVEGFEWTQQEVADLLGLSRSTVQRHLERGLSHLRSELKVESHV